VFYMSEDESLRDLGGAESDLPRIVVEDDSIIVFEENNWGERDVVSDEGDNDEGDVEERGLEDLAVSYDEGLIESVVEGREGDVEEKSGKDFYDVGKFEGAYEEVGEAEYDVGLHKVEERTEEVWGKRSGLEIAGFRDFEAEEKRRRRREEFG
jgi:hypothetical protein